MSFGNLTRLLFKIWASFFLLFWNQHDRLITQVQLKNYNFILQRMIFYNYIALKEVIVNSENTIAFIH